MVADTDVFTAAAALYAGSDVVIDRPRGSRHPRYAEAEYPVDYGYLDATTSGDGQGVDVFRGTDEGAGVVGLLVTVDVLKRDTEVKFVADCSAAEATAVRDFVAALGLPHTYIGR